MKTGQEVAVISWHPGNASWELPWLLFQHFYLPALDSWKNKEGTGEVIQAHNKNVGDWGLRIPKQKRKRGALHMPRVRLGINPNLIHPAFSFVHFLSLLFSGSGFPLSPNTVVSPLF